MVSWRTNQNIALLRSAGQMAEALHYKHLAPLERKQLTVLHFEVEFANDKWKTGKRLGRSPSCSLDPLATLGLLTLPPDSRST